MTGSHNGNSYRNPLNHERIGIIILAAGGSARLGSPKQLLDFEERSLIRRATETAVSCRFGPICIVLGADAERSCDEIHDLPVEIVINDLWKNGISTSIRSGLERLVEIEPEISAVIFTLCDQPLVNSDTLVALVQTFKIQNTRF